MFGLTLGGIPGGAGSSGGGSGGGARVGGPVLTWGLPGGSINAAEAGKHKFYNVNVIVYKLK